MNEEVKESILDQLRNIYDSLLDGDEDEAMIQIEGLIEEVKDINEIY